jgi:hypothetical protein
MLAVSLTFLTPRAGLLALLGLVPVIAFLDAARRVDRTRSLLRLPAPPRAKRRLHAVVLAAIVALLAVTTMQPALRTQATLRARTDAQVFVVLDTSRSMTAAPSARSATRLARAKRIARNLAAELGDVPVGVATFTDRVLPDLFPTSDHAVFDSTVSAVGIEDPPPRDVNPVATTFGALSSLATQGFFPDHVHKRVAVVVTDGESAPFDPNAVASSLDEHDVRLTVVRVGGGADRVWGANGKPEVAYRADPAGARRQIDSLESALGGSRGVTPASFVERAVGNGPRRAVGIAPRTRTLAPLPALIALGLLAALFHPRRFVVRRAVGTGGDKRETLA